MGQPELQTTLVFIHEMGHNFGAKHDKTPEEGGSDASLEDGVYVMYPYAPSGAKDNNDAFSPLSVKDISEAMADRAGCFLNDEGASSTCGNFVTDADGGEECDCGGTDAACRAFDPAGSCGADCTLQDGCQCYPLDANGLCCSS